MIFADRASISATTSSIDHNRLSIPAAIAGEVRSVLWIRTKDYLRHKLLEAFPKAEALAGQMRVTTVIKDITWNTLNDSGFVDWLRKQWPQRTDLRQPFEQYRAARERMNSAADRRD